MCRPGSRCGHADEAEAQTHCRLLEASKLQQPRPPARAVQRRVGQSAHKGGRRQLLISRQCLLRSLALGKETARRNHHRHLDEAREAHARRRAALRGRGRRRFSLEGRWIAREAKSVVETRVDGLEAAERAAHLVRNFGVGIELSENRVEIGELCRDGMRQEMLVEVRCE